VPRAVPVHDWGYRTRRREPTGRHLAGTLMSKGTRREKEACELYEQAGHTTYRPATVQYGENDVFGLFDLIAVHPARKPRYVQVKSNRASGINAWMDDATDLMPPKHAVVEFAVCHDREGWRVAQPAKGGYEWVYDGRSSQASMGDPFIDMLERGEV